MFTSINNYQPKKHQFKFDSSKISHNINKVDFRKGLITEKQLSESETSLKNGLTPKVYNNPTVDIISNRYWFKSI